jgi:hypothetical protein
MHNPTPDDFLTSDGYQYWTKSVRMPFQVLLVKLLQDRFIDPSGKERWLQGKHLIRQNMKLFFKIVEARKLISRDNDSTSRETYCHMDIFREGETPEDHISVQTEVVKGTDHPTWNQHLDIDVNSYTDDIYLRVIDQKKGDFLGQVLISVGDLMTAAVKEGYMRRWLPLQPNAKQKSKYVGGEIYIEAMVKDPETVRLTLTYF